MKEKINFRIPSRYRVGGQDVKIEYVDNSVMSDLGRLSVADGKIAINTNQSETSKANTFCHEMVHSILETAGCIDLNHDEQFVSTFAGFLMEVINSIEFDNIEFEDEKSE